MKAQRLCPKIGGRARRSERFGAYDRWVLGIAPDMNDRLVSKLVALRDKDRDFITSYHKARPLQFDALLDLLAAMPLPPEKLRSIQDFLDSLR